MKRIYEKELTRCDECPYFSGTQEILSKIDNDDYNAEIDMKVECKKLNISYNIYKSGGYKEWSGYIYEEWFVKICPLKAY